MRRCRSPPGVTFVLKVLAEKGLLRGHAIGIDATTLEANAAQQQSLDRVPALVVDSTARLRLDQPSDERTAVTWVSGAFDLHWKKLLVLSAGDTVAAKDLAGKQPGIYIIAATSGSADDAYAYIASLALENPTAASPEKSAESLEECARRVAAKLANRPPPRNLLIAVCKFV